MDENQQAEGSWWRTIPGILTAAAGILTAVTGLIVALQQSGLLKGGEKPAPDRLESRADTPTAGPTASQILPAPRAPGAESSGPGKPNVAPRPWSESEAVVTSTDGIATVVSAESLGNCISSSKELTLASGQSIGFEKMRAFEFTRDNVKPTLVITLLNGKTVQGTMNMGCEIVGNNELGRFNLPYEKLRRVEFKR